MLLGDHKVITRLKHASSPSDSAVVQGVISQNQHVEFTVQMDALQRVLALLEQHCKALLDFTGEFGETTALHIGSAVGGFTCVLAESFQQVLGVESRQELHLAARELLAAGSRQLAPTAQVSSCSLVQL
jgi:protein-L-isoaspartate O-methyltransferase